MSILLEVNGERYTDFVAADVSLRLDSLSSTFSFQATSEDGNPLPVREGDPCVIYVDGDKVLTGSIEMLEGSASSSSHSILVTGRDKTGDLLDSTLDTISDLSAPITLISIIRKVIDQLGLDIAVIDHASPKPFNEAEDVVSPEPGQNAWEFIQKYANKRQVLLTSDEEGDIQIRSSDPVDEGAVIRHLLKSDQNNAVSSNFTSDSTGRYNLYKMSSSLNPVALNSAGVADLDSLVDQSGREIDSDIRQGRQLVLIAEASFSNEQSKPRATWEANLRKSRGVTYSCVVQGFSVDESGLWFINTLVSIRDDFWGINASMLLNTINFSFTLSGGSKSQLGFVNKNSYTLTLQDDATEEIGDGLTQQD